MELTKKQRWNRYCATYIYKRRYQWLCENGPCVRCGSMKDLEVDHIDPALKVEHWVWDWSKERREAELAKCQVLCFVCHVKKTNEQMGWGKHGAAGYRRGCRCEECRKGHTARWMDWHHRRKAKLKEHQ